MEGKEGLPAPAWLQTWSLAACKRSDARHDPLRNVPPMHLMGFCSCSPPRLAADNGLGGWSYPRVHYVREMLVKKEQQEAGSPAEYSAQGGQRDSGVSLPPRNSVLSPCQPAAAKV